MARRLGTPLDAGTRDDIDRIVKHAGRMARLADRSGATPDDVKGAAERLRRRLTAAPDEDRSVGGLLQDEILKRKIRPIAVELWATRILCVNDFDREAGRDEIFIGAIAHDIYNNRDTLKSPVKVGEFGKKERGKPTDIPDVKLAEIPVGPGLWRDSLYFATIYLGEKDFGGMKKYMEKNGLSSKQFFEITTAMYLTSVSSLLGVSIATDGGLASRGLLTGLATGAAPLLIPGYGLVSGIAAAIVEGVVGAVVHAVADDMFPPIVVPYHLYVPAGGSLEGLNTTGTAKFRFLQEKRRGSNEVAYDVAYEWRVRTAPASDADFVITPATEAKTEPEATRNLDKIEHIVVVMLENRSFDQMCGFLKHERKRPDFVERTDFLISNPLIKADVDREPYFGSDGKPILDGIPDGKIEIRPHPLAETFLEMDGGHSILHAARQVFGDVLGNQGDVAGKFDPHWPEGNSAPENPNAVYGFLEERMKGFVRDAFIRCHGLGELGGLTRDEFVERIGRVMGYHPAVHVPTFDLFATEFCVCTRWFSSFPGNTWVNRTIAMTGSPARAIVAPRDARGAVGKHVEHVHWIVDNQMPFDERSFFHTLDEHTYKGQPIRWACYAQDFPSLLCIDASYASELKNRVSGQPNRLRPIGRFFEDAQNGTLPHVSWVDPNFMDVGEMKDNLFGWNPRGEWDQRFLDTEAANDDHPPIDVAHGQAFVMAILRALMKSPQWNKTMLIVTYDEHGGFFDHVEPPENPDWESESPAFTHLGLRVPAFVVSPWVERQLVSATPFDHTSIIKTILTKFCRGADGKIPEVSKRVNRAQHLGGLLNGKQPRFANTSTRGASMSSLADGLSAVLSVRAQVDAERQKRERQQGVRRPPTELQQQLHEGRRAVLERVFKR